MTDERETRLRADARRNRDRILAAAKSWFAAHGPDAPTEEIARTAGVAPGTLYRHFADRDTLITAVVLNTLDKALTEARAAVTDEDSAWDALVRILHQSQELRLSIRLVTASPAVHKVLKSQRTAELRRRAMIEVLDGVVREAQAEGTLRTDVGTGDVAVMFSLLAHPLHIEPTGTAELASERCMALLLECLRPGTSARLPGRPLTPSDIGV
jgi:AcrR family transcriptional regulator